MTEGWKMRTQSVDLYRFFGRTAPPGGAGTLLCLSPDIPAGLPRCLRPGVLILPGGGYSHVSRREGEPVALRFMARGYAAFVLTYSCAPLVYPTALEEAGMAMAYIRGQASEFDLDPDMVAAVGFSAGAHVCGCLGTLFDRPVMERIGPPEAIRPQVLGLNYPVAVSWGRTHEESFRNLTGGDPALTAALSLDTLVRQDMPPVFLWHTRDDPSVPCRNSLELARALEEAGVDFALHIYRKGPHGLATADEQSCAGAMIQDISWDVPGWLEAELRFFADQGLTIREGAER